MTPEIEKKRRELFDAWFDKEVLSTISYGSPDILKRQMWRPFNAALDAVEIELPNDRSLSASDDPWQVKEWCADAITDTGLGLKIKG